MTTLYKLTDQNGYTRACHDNACLWGPGVSHSGAGEGELCGPGWVHAYTHPLLAVLLNPIHAGFSNPRLWEADGNVVMNDGVKVGCRTLTTVRELPLPVITTEQRVRFAILCAREVSRSEQWNLWAERWLSGEDRSRKAAAAAGAAARAAWASWAAAAAGAAWAAAARTAWAAAEAAEAAAAEAAARAASWAAEARAAKRAAAEAAAMAAARAAALDIVALAEKACAILS